MDEKYILKVQANEDRSKSNERRIVELEGEVKNNNELVLKVGELAVEIKHMREDYQRLAEEHVKEIKAIDLRLTTIEAKPARKWEQLVSLIFTGIVTAILGFVLAKLGL